MIVPLCAMLKICVFSIAKTKAISKHGQTCSYQSFQGPRVLTSTTVGFSLCCLFEHIVVRHTWFEICQGLKWLNLQIRWKDVGLVHPGASCAGQLSPVVCFHSYWTFSARQNHPARPYRMGRRLFQVHRVLVFLTGCGFYILYDSGTCHYL